MSNDTFNALPIFGLVILAFILGLGAVNYYSKPVEVREAVEKAKYTIHVEWEMGDHNVNDYTFTNGVLSFYDVFQQKQFYTSKSFSIKTN